jgi:hypothetical protein
MGKKVKGMTEVVSNRTYTLATTKGHVVRFYKGIPKNVPNVILEDCMSVGILPTDDNDVPNAEERNPLLPHAAVGSERVRQIREVVEALIERNQRGDFAASGLPSLVVLNEALGYKIEQSELGKVWHTIRQEQAESRILSQEEMKHEGPVKPNDSAELAVALEDAIASVMVDNNEHDFTAAGAPTVRSLENRLGYDLTEDERDSAWDTYKAERKGSATTSKSKPKKEETTE